MKQGASQSPGLAVISVGSLVRAVKYSERRKYVCAVEECPEPAVTEITGSLALGRERVVCKHLLCKKHEKKHDRIYPVGVK